MANEVTPDVVLLPHLEKQPQVGLLRKYASAWDQDGVRGDEVKVVSRVADQM